MRANRSGELSWGDWHCCEACGFCANLETGQSQRLVSCTPKILCTRAPRGYRAWAVDGLRGGRCGLVGAV